jgi:uncharacterized membrane protein YadS
MQMNSFTLALITAVLITVILLCMKSNENKENNTQYGVKIFVISFISVFVVHTYISNDCNVRQEIDVGEPPF